MPINRSIPLLLRGLEGGCTNPTGSKFFSRGVAHQIFHPNGKRGVLVLSEGLVRYLKLQPSRLQLFCIARVITNGPLNEGLILNRVA